LSEMMCKVALVARINRGVQISERAKDECPNMVLPLIFKIYGLSRLPNSTNSLTVKPLVSGSLRG